MVLGKWMYTFFESEIKYANERMKKVVRERERGVRGAVFSFVKLW